MTNAIQIKNGSEARLVEEVRARGGIVSTMTRSGLMPFGPCVVAFAWRRDGSALVITYQVPAGCEGFEDSIDELFSETSRSTANTDRAWQTPALLAAIVLAVALVVWGKT